MRIIVFGLAAGLAVGATLPSRAAETCPNPNAIGTSRTITVDPQVMPHIGTMQYKESLPLEDHEVVLTFDDGPLPPYTNRILDILAENCVKVDYFLVGQMARAYPNVVRRIYNSGHIVGTHSMHHPLTFNHMGEASLAKEVEGGIAAVDDAIGDPRAVAPFFRIPGLLRSATSDAYLASKSLAVWSADEVADDWHRGITPKQIVALAMRRIEAKGHRGVLLLHDIHPATVAALPMLLKELKANGYKIVQAVPAGDRPASVPERTIAKVATTGAKLAPSAASPQLLPLADPRNATAEPVLKRVAHHPRRTQKHGRRNRDRDVVGSLDKDEPDQSSDSGFGWSTMLWH